MYDRYIQVIWSKQMIDDQPFRNLEWYILSGSESICNWDEHRTQISGWTNPRLKFNNLN